MPIPKRKSIPDRSITKLQDVNLERAKNLATIFSAVAIPIVITVAGYLIQRQLADDSLKKDYVGIATGILKENRSNQEPELRAWATSVLAKYSPVPFSKKVEESFFIGAGVGPAWLGPPSDCRRLPGKRTFTADMHQLVNDLEKSNKSKDRMIELMQIFFDKVARQEGEVLLTRTNLECVLQWVDYAEQADIDFRKSMGAPSSKSIFEEYDRKKAALKEVELGGRNDGVQEIQSK